MRFVVFDLEANADDPRAERQEIIEIGAIAVEGEEVVGEFVSLLRPTPGRRLAPLTVELTGITDKDLEGAPGRRPTLKGFVDFCSDLPLVAHNGSTYDFPLLDAELERVGVEAPPGERLDTLDLAHLVFPRAGREATSGVGGDRPPTSRRLGDLLNHYRPGNATEAAHRALADTQSVWEVMRGLLDDLSRDVPAREAQRWLLEVTGHPWAMFCGSGAGRSSSGFRPDLVEIIPLSPQSEQDVSPELAPDSPDEPPDFPDWPMIDLDQLVSPLTSTGDLMGEGMEHRPSQEAMAREVAEALLESGSLMVEAPTGTGKTLAYLVPACRLASAHSTQVLVSTYTKALQDQVCLTLADISDRLGPIRWTVLKGLSNYLSVNALADELALLDPLDSGRLRDNPLFSEEVSEVDADQHLGMALAVVVGWVAETPTGEWDDLRDRWLRNNSPAMYRLKHRLSVTETPAGARNELERRCFFLRALRRLSEAQIVVANHSLMLLRDQMTADSPALIVDEAHEMESAARTAFTPTIGNRGLWRLLYGVYGSRSSSNLLYRYLRSLPAGPARDRGQVAAERVVRFWRRCQATIDDAQEILEEFLAATRGWSGEPGEDPLSTRITRVDLNRSAWIEVTDALEALAEAFSHLHLALEALPVPDQLAANRSPKELRRRITQWSSEAKTVSELGFQMAKIGTDNLLKVAFVCGLATVEDKVRWELSLVPLEVNELLREIWEDKDSVVMTSATLTVAGSFDYIAAGLGFEDSAKVTLDSPFPEIDRQMLVVVPGYLPAPSGADLEKFAESSPEEMARLFEVSDGRALALFTANRRMDAAAHYLKDRLFPGFRILCQGEASTPELTEMFRHPSVPTVLLGSGTFWQGIDVPGESLSLLVMEKLPFSSPADPVVAARQEMIARRGGRPFDDYLLPQAVLGFRQGAGRLIRTPNDRGVLVVLDKRLGYARYASSFLESLTGAPPVLKAARPDQCYGAVARHLASVGRSLRSGAASGRR